MPAAGEGNTRPGGAKSVKKATRKPKPRVVKARPPKFTEQIPVRPGAVTKKTGKPSSQAQRTHVHKARVERNREVAKAQAGHDVTTNADLGKAKAFNEANPVKHKQSQADLYLTDPKALKKAGFKAPGVLDRVAKAPGAFTANAFKDAAELAATTPTSTYLLGKTAVTDPKKVPGMLAAPYKELAKNPAKFVFEKPVSTALMAAPAVKVPKLAAGKALRLTGHQTLKGATKSLPGSVLKEETRRSKDAVKNARQARRDKQNPEPVMTPSEVRRRVDEHFEYRRKHTRRVEASVTRTAKQEVKQAGVPKRERKQVIAEKVEGARGGAGTQNDRTFVREFGSPWQVDAKSGAVLKPKQAIEGHLHASRGDADKVVERLKAAGQGEFTVKAVGEDRFGVVPKVAAEQLRHHQAVGKSKSTGAKVLRVTRQKFTNAVLPTSPKWLTGQLVEGTLRANIHAGGPIGVATGLARERKVFKALEKQRPGAGKEFRQRALPGGHYGGQVQEFRATPLHEIFDASDGKLGEALAAAGRAGQKTPGAKRVVSGWNKYTSAVFDQVNGRFIEGTQQRAMLGRALKDSPLMERKILGLSKKAAEEAAEGLKGTETQVQLGRAVQRAYGRYSNFSPAQRERNLHWTPFAPWYGNAVRFLVDVLPRDHPVIASLLAAANSATEKERREMGLSLFSKDGKFSLGDEGHKPLFMQGGVPVKGGNVIRAGHYTPFGIAGSKPSENLASLFLPQFSGAYKNLLGIDWKGDPLKVGSGFKAKDFSEPQVWARALASEAQSLTPFAGQLSRITGVEDKLSGKKDPTLFEGPDKGKRLLARLNKEVNPTRPTGAGDGKPKKRRRKKRVNTDILSGSGPQTDILK